MGLIAGFAIYDSRGKLIAHAGTLPSSISKINKKIVVDATAKIICGDGNIIYFMSNGGMRYFTSTLDPDGQSKCLSMLQEMSLSPIEKAVVIYESYTTSPIIIQDIPDAAIITLREDALGGGVDETSTLIASDEDSDVSFDKKERAHCRKIISLSILATMVAIILGLAASSLIFVIVTDRPF